MKHSPHVKPRSAARTYAGQWRTTLARATPAPTDVLVQRDNLVEALACLKPFELLCIAARLAGFCNRDLEILFEMGNAEVSETFLRARDRIIKNVPEWRVFLSGRTRGKQRYRYTSPEQIMCREGTLYTLAETAQALGTDDAAIIELLKRDVFPGAWHMGKTWYIPKEDVESCDPEIAARVPDHPPGTYVHATAQ